MLEMIVYSLHRLMNSTKISLRELKGCYDVNNIAMNGG